uniref:Intercellular adhesion molecule N-terminal domain-containing protein n=1 Tax=Catharus ustulatus TaxID=91951 RepID=A0A8C3UD36_CATUS
AKSRGARICAGLPAAGCWWLSPPLTLHFSCPGRPANRLVVTPQEPVVPFGGSTDLNCSLACAGGKVEWWGLDIALGTISSFSTYSILHIRHATVATEGTKVCWGRCQGQDYRKTTELKVYGKRSPAWIPKVAPFLLSFAVLPKITLNDATAVLRSPPWRVPAQPGLWPPQHFLQGRVSLQVIPPQHRSPTLGPPSIWLLLPTPPPRSPLCPGTSPQAAPRHVWPPPPPSLPLARQGQCHLRGQFLPAACRSGRYLPPGRGAGPCASSATLSAPGTPRWAGSGPPQPSRSTGRRPRAAAPRCGWTAPSPGTRATTSASCLATAATRPAWR